MASFSLNAPLSTAFFKSGFLYTFPKGFSIKSASVTFARLSAIFLRISFRAPSNRSPTSSILVSEAFLPFPPFAPSSLSVSLLPCCAGLFFSVTLPSEDKSGVRPERPPASSELSEGSMRIWPPSRSACLLIFSSPLSSM